MHEHSETAQGWHIALTAGSARSSVDLAGYANFVETKAVPYHAPDRSAIILSPKGDPTVIHLGEDHYRRSEAGWGSAGKPSATISLAWTGTSLRIDVDVPISDLAFASATALNPYDNEPADINGDGIQLYVRTASGDVGWLLVPEAETSIVRIRRIETWSLGSAFDQSANLPNVDRISATWTRSDAGYAIHIELVADTPPLAFDVIVNEMPRGRERRRGQLVLSGAAREFTYLRGDRHEQARLVPLRLSDD